MPSPAVSIRFKMLRQTWAQSLSRVSGMSAGGCKTYGHLLPAQVAKWKRWMCAAGPAYKNTTAQVPQFYAAQAAAYLQPGSAGWFLRTLKNSPGKDLWSFEAALANGWLAPLL